MKHREPVAGQLVAGVLRALPQEKALAVPSRRRAEKPASLELVLVTDAHGRLLGATPFARIIALHSEAPIATVIQDILSLLVYFAVVRLFGI
jgi:hypothetical protein